MAIVTPPYADPGRASFEELDTYTQNFLLAGSHPVLAPAYPFPAAALAAFAQFSVVGLVAGEIVMANATTIKPIGVLAHAVVAGDGRAHVFYSGCFNQDALVWDASFTTDALKQAAFRDSPTPTTIIVAKRA